MSCFTFLFLVSLFLYFFISLFLCFICCFHFLPVLLSAAGRTNETVLQIRLMIILCFLPRKESSNDCPDQDDRCQSDKQPFQCVKDNSGDSAFRVMIIPVQVRAV